MRKIQQSRKNADYQLDNHIALRIEASPRLQSIVAPFLDLLKYETLTQDFAWGAGDGAYRVEEVEFELRDTTEKVKLFTRVVPAAH